MLNNRMKKLSLLTFSILAVPTLLIAEPGRGFGPGPGRPGPGGPGFGGRGGEATQAVRSLESADDMLRRGMVRGADRYLDSARRNLYNLRLDGDLRAAIRAIDSAMDTLNDRRMREHDCASGASRYVRQAIGFVRNSDAYRFEQGGGHGGGGHGGRDQFECTARDSGWEEHRGGHIGRGFMEHMARAEALRECQRFHGRCTVECRRVR